MRFKMWHLNGELIRINAAWDNFVKNEIFKVSSFLLMTRFKRSNPQRLQDRVSPRSHQFLTMPLFSFYNDTIL